ncbi:MAG TPA: hypothetical protein VL946_08040 [Lacibacter sp.]|jgi:hypothetical protein|nr:hypothetical protein [Lacibacter sp.]
MKQLIMFSLSFLFISITAMAQDTDYKKEKKRIKQEQKEMMRDLDLADNQGEQVKDINDRYKDEHKAIAKNDALTQEQKREQIQALNKRRVQEIHNLIGEDKTKDWSKGKKNKMKDKAKDKDDKVKEKMKEKKEKKNSKA